MLSDGDAHPTINIDSTLDTVILIFFIFLANAKGVAPLAAGASVDADEKDVTTESPENNGAGSGCPPPSCSASSFFCVSCGKPWLNSVKFVNRDGLGKWLDGDDPRRWHRVCDYDCAESILNVYDENNDKRYDRLLQMIPVYRRHRESLKSKSSLC